MQIIALQASLRRVNSIDIEPEHGSEHTHNFTVRRRAVGREENEAWAHGAESPRAHKHPLYRHTLLRLATNAYCTRWVLRKREPSKSPSIIAWGSQNIDACVRHRFLPDFRPCSFQIGYNLGKRARRGKSVDDSIGK